MIRRDSPPNTPFPAPCQAGRRGGTLLGLIAAVAAVPLVWFLPWLVGAGREPIPPLVPGDAAPRAAAAVLRVPGDPDDTRVVQAWAEGGFPNWKTQGKVSAPRVCLAKLQAGRDIEEVNRYLLAAEPWAASGSTWSAHRGDYDFTEATLTAILYLFGEDPSRLWPETVEHLLTTLLLEEGNTPRLAAPYTLGYIVDTENHHLMTEGSRYLKNQWLFRRGGPGREGNPAYDNRANGMEAWMCAHLRETVEQGVYEFNAIPYLGYTVQALLNLEAFPESEELRGLARHILDTMNWQYALGSHGFRRCAPFRRRYNKAHTDSLQNDSHTQVMRFWCAPESWGYFSGQPGRPHQELIAACMPYRVPEAVKAWTLAKPREYFVRMGRGPKACPELYSGAPDFLLSAGGAFRGQREMIVPRPITLMLPDAETRISRCFHIPGNGRWWWWNSTGVHRRFAVGRSPGRVPEQYSPAAEGGGWAVFTPSDAPGLAVAVFSAEELGIIALFPEGGDGAEELLARICAANPDSDALREKFFWPDGGNIEYDVKAPRNRWVIRRVDGTDTDRDFGGWPMWDGDIPTEVF